MIWHIFRKDWKLLWWKVLIVEALLVCGAVATSRQGHFSTGTPPTWETAGALLTFAAGLFLLADLAQMDPLAGAGQDWIARPIRRVDLLLAKMLFLWVAIVPMGVIEATQNLANGFPPGRSLAGAMVDMLSALASTGLPLLAFAALFNSLTEMIAAAFIVVLSKMMVGLLLQDGFRFPLNGATTGSGISWVIDYAQSWVYFAGALVVLAMQYFRRRTIRARWVAVVVLVITSFAPLLPWQYAFAVEQRVSPTPVAGAKTNVFFNLSGGRTNGSLSGQTICIPIVVSGVADNSWVNVDSVKASVLDGDKIVWSHRISGASDTSTSIWNKMRGDLMGTKSGGNCQPLDIPLDQLKGFENQSTSVQLEYSLTLFGPDKSYAMPAVGGDQRMPGVGWCQTRMKNQLELGCISDTAPACLEVWKTNTPASHAWYCKPDYDAIRGVDTDPWGGPLNIAVHEGDTLVLQTYRPLDHFERVVTTSEIKLHDWLTAGQ